MLTGKKLYALTPEQVQFYRENGYLLLKSVFTREEAQYLRDEAHALIHRLAQVYSENGINAAWGSAREVTSLPTQLLHCHNAQYHSAAFARLMLDPRLIDRIADLIGENIQLHHTKLFIKPPEKGAPFPMHRTTPTSPTKNTPCWQRLCISTTRPSRRGAFASCQAATSWGHWSMIHTGAGICR